MPGCDICCLTGRGGRALCKVAASAVFLRCGGRDIDCLGLLPQLRDLRGKGFAVIPTFAAPAGFD